MTKHELDARPMYPMTRPAPSAASCSSVPPWAARGRGLRSTRLILSALAILCSLAVCGDPASAAQKKLYRDKNPHGPIKIPCESCHTLTSWSPIRSHPDFDHRKTAFPLRGMHAGVSCAQCHTSLEFSDAGTKCVDCHADIHRRQFGSNCEQCHSVLGWRASLQAVNNHQNRFPLMGAHAAVDCDSCHKSAAVGLFRGLGTSCVSCHQADFQKAKAPDHLAAKFPTTCENCHGMDSWFGSSFNHNQATRFPLTGMHAQTGCLSCHAGGRFAGTPMTCIGCHATDFSHTTDPNHVTSGFSQDCSICHTTASWENANFDHNGSGFPLTGAHATVACTQCHANNQFTGISTACSSCHLADFNATKNPNHAASGFPQGCAACHTTTSWLGAVFDHSRTQFPLTGAHATVDCSKCHVNNVFTGTATQCVACHLADFNNAKNPNHAAAGFPQDCTTCHSTTGWQGASFDHSKTGFALTGDHATLTCVQCHANNRYAGTPATCAGCHQKDFNGTSNPNHAQAGFPTDCSLCHSTTSWQGATFDHSKTRFPLTGAHSNLQCASCHASGQYATLPTTCVSCHLAQFNGTTNPNHAAAGFPQDCSLCHNTTTFSTATFDHSKTSFPLTGAHANVACASCHIGNVFSGTPTACFSCHAADYQSTTNPNHASAGFPTTCATCHTTTTWAGATFDHTWFPMTHGGAKMCSDCHQNPTNYSVFQCTNCHTKAQTDSRHTGVSGYVYNSANCYQCHPRGKGDL